MYVHLLQSYVVQAMWIAIMTLAMSGTVYYLIYFDRHVRANSTHRLAARRLILSLLDLATGSHLSNQRVTLSRQSCP